MKAVEVMEWAGLVERLEGTRAQRRAARLLQRIEMFLGVGAAAGLAYIGTRTSEAWQATHAVSCTFSAMFHGILLMTPMAMLGLAIAAVAAYVTANEH